MYCYEITNKINNKKYIGITIDFNRRMKQHINGKTDSLIHRAILKYGKKNFSFEIIGENLTVEEAEQMEIDTIKSKNTLSPNGYNLAKGGLHGGTRIRITDEQVQKIKDNRNIPMYVLYEEFSNIMCYKYFQEIYHDNIRKDIIPKVNMYPYNLEFSCQFTKSKLTYYDIVDIRKKYAQHVHWEQAYQDYKDKIAKSTFWEIYIGRSFKLVMPEVFTEENKKYMSSLAHQGERNAKAKLKKEDVLNIRKLYEEDHLKRIEISKLYPYISYSTINDILSYRTWKNI